MSSPKIYAAVTLSLTKLVEEFRQAQMLDAAYVNWDAHAQIGELPQQDAIGLAGVGLAEDEPGHYEVAAAVALSTWDDMNLIRLTKLVSDFFDLLPISGRVAVFNPADGTPMSFMVVAGPRSVSPVGKAETRSVQALEFRLLLSPDA